MHVCTSSVTETERPARLAPRLPAENALRRVLSQFRSLLCGVPQGFVVRLLFLLYTVDAGSIA